MRSYQTVDGGSAIFRLKDHYERLFYSASILELEIPYTIEELMEVTMELLRKNNLSAGYIRPVAMFGENKMGLNPKGAVLEVFIAVWPWGKYLSDKPIRVGISPWIRIHPKSLQCDAKVTGHYVNSILSNLWAVRNNYKEALILDFEGNVAEGPGENLFIIKDGKLLTPKPGSILPGITRNSIMQIAKKELGIETIEKTITKEEVFAADEVFFTGTAAEVTIIESVDGKKIGDQKNEVSEKLKTIYDEVVRGGKDQYKDWLSYL